VLARGGEVVMYVRLVSAAHVYTRVPVACLGGARLKRSGGLLEARKISYCAELTLFIFGLRAFGADMSRVLRFNSIRQSN
jgi:hypothetical protein